MALAHVLVPSLFAFGVAAFLLLASALVGFALVPARLQFLGSPAGVDVSRVPNR